VSFFAAVLDILLYFVFRSQSEKRNTEQWKLPCCRRLKESS
jgi:hypothetical protein